MSSFICLGDFGTGNDIQLSVSKLIENLDKNIKCKFIIGLGDNIYPDGVESVHDSQFYHKFAKIYQNLPPKIKFYNCLGNHDYHGKISSQCKYTYSNQNKHQRWVMPYNYYSFGKVFGVKKKIPVDFFAIDTHLYNLIDKEKDQKQQENWLIREINRSTAKWIIVFGHHPWISSGSHGNCGEKLDDLYSKITSDKMKRKVDIILSGHDHDKQHIYIPNKPHLLISGAGGKLRHNPPEIRNMSLGSYLNFYSESLGCILIDFKDDHLNIEIYKTDNNLRHSLEYQYMLKK